MSPQFDANEFAAGVLRVQSADERCERAKREAFESCRAADRIVGIDRRKSGQAGALTPPPGDSQFQAVPGHAQPLPSDGCHAWHCSHSALQTTRGPFGGRRQIA